MHDVRWKTDGYSKRRPTLSYIRLVYIRPTPQAVCRRPTHGHLHSHSVPKLAYCSMAVYIKHVSSSQENVGSVPVPTYCAAIRLTFDVSSWKLAHRLLRPTVSSSTRVGPTRYAFIDTNSLTVIWITALHSCTCQECAFVLYKISYHTEPI